MGVWPSPWLAGIDWNNDGDWGDTGENVTARVLDRDGITIRLGRGSARSYDQPNPGEAALSLRNTSRDYSPENSSSPLYGNLVPGRAVIVQATYGGTTYTLYRGYVDDYTVLPNRGERAAQFSCLDGLARLGESKISTPLYAAVRTGTVLGYILDAAGWAGGRDIDAGASIIRWWWEDGTDALTAARRVLAAEGPPALMFIDAGTGNFTFRDRHHRYLRAASTTVQATFNNGGTAETGSVVAYSQPAAYETGWKDIINTVTGTCDIRAQQAETVVWESADWRRIEAGSAITVPVHLNDPVAAAATPAATIDYWANGGVTAALDRTSGQSLIITFTNGDGVARGIWGLRLRACPVTVVSSETASSTDAASVTAYGTRSGETSAADFTWCDPATGAAVAEILTSRYAQRRNTMRIRVLNASTSRLTQALTRDLSDRIHIDDTELGLSADFHIERIEYAASHAGRVLEAVFHAEKAPTAPTAPFTFGANPNGKFGTGRFGL